MKAIDEETIAIPKAVQHEHIIENATSASVQFTQEDLDKLDQAFPKPQRKMHLDMV